MNRSALKYSNWKFSGFDGRDLLLKNFFLILNIECYFYLWDESLHTCRIVIHEAKMEVFQEMEGSGKPFP